MENPGQLEVTNGLMRGAVVEGFGRELLQGSFESLENCWSMKCHKQQQEQQQHQQEQCQKQQQFFFFRPSDFQIKSGGQTGQRERNENSKKVPFL